MVRVLLNPGPQEIQRPNGDLFGFKIQDIGMNVVVKKLWPLTG